MDTPKVTIYTLIIFFMCISLSTWGQPPVRFNYQVAPDFSTKGRLIEVSENSAGVKTYTPRTIVREFKAGKITINETHDTLTIVPWYNTSNPKDQSTTAYLQDNSGSDTTFSDESTYVYEINWARHRVRNILGTSYPIAKVPFRFGQFAVTSLPFRINLHTGEFQNEFLNANIAYLFVYGKTKFYKSKFLEPRSNYWAFGPYIGASTVKETENGEEKDAFGFNYGVNAVRSISNINLTMALGAETSFKSKANAFNPYIGIGLGIKLIEFYEPENKDE